MWHNYNKTYIFFSYFQVSGIWRRQGLLPLQMFQNAKEHQAEKKTVKKSHTIRTEPATWIKKKDYLTSPSLLSSLCKMLQSCFQTKNCPAEKLLGAKLQQTTWQQMQILTLVLRKPLVCCSLKFRDTEFLSLPSHAESSDRCILRNKVWQLQFHPIKKNLAFNTGHYYSATSPITLLEIKWKLFVLSVAEIIN